MQKEITPELSITNWKWQLTWALRLPACFVLLPQSKMEHFLLSAAFKLQYSRGYCQLSPVNLPLSVMLSDYSKWVKYVPIGWQTRHERILECIKKKKLGSKWLPLYRENLYYSLRSKSITKFVLVYITKADCNGHTCSVSSMNRNILIFNTRADTETWTPC